MMQQSSFQIKEIFYSLQGEGFYAGTPALFIRFAGCNLKCPFCDTDFKEGEKWTIWEIDSFLRNMPESPNLVVLTGGEPTLQVTPALCILLHQFFKVVAMETNGTIADLPGGVDFVTVSPKDDYTKAICRVTEAGEVKVVFDGKHDPERWRKKIRAKHYFLQPCDTGDGTKNKEIVAQCVEYIKAHPAWRLSLQTQKILDIR